MQKVQCWKKNQLMTAVMNLCLNTIIRNQTQF